MKPNILFILLDGARWDRMDISPEIKELKSEGTTFTNISSAIPYTFGAMNVIFTGLYGNENSRPILYSSIIFIIIQIGLIIGLAEIYGITGIAIATVLAYTGRSIYLVIADRKTMDLE